MLNWFKKHGLYILAGNLGAISALTLHDVEIVQEQSHVLIPRVEQEPLRASNSEKPTSHIIVKKDSSDSGDSKNGPNSKCTQKCEVLHALLYSEEIIDDEIYEKRLSDAHAFSEFLRDNVQLQNEFIKIALRTTDANKRNLIIETFKRLPKDQSEDFAFTLFQADSWGVRAKGVELLEDNNEISESAVETYYELLSREENPYVKARLIQSLVYSKNLSNHRNLFPTLNSEMQYSTDASVRSSALKTKIELSDDKNELINDAVFALQSGQEKFQLAGLAAYERLLIDSESENNTAKNISKADLLKELEKIFDSMKHLSGDDVPKDLFNEAYNVYNRYSE